MSPDSVWSYTPSAEVAYPWPGEEQVIFDLFTDYAAVGALLLTYHGQDGVRLARKVRR